MANYYKSTMSIKKNHTAKLEINQSSEWALLPPVLQLQRCMWEQQNEALTLTIAEHRNNCHFGQLEKSAVAAQTVTQDKHSILFEDTHILDGTSNYSTWIHGEVIKIH